MAHQAPNRIIVELLHHTPIAVCAHAIRTCWQSFAKGDGGGEIDCSLIERVGNEYRHSSTLEHLVYSFYIRGISRACLQELARHRIASLSVKSTRYTLKELRKEASFLPSEEGENQRRAERFIVFTGDARVDCASIAALENLRALLCDGVSNDVAKFAMPECYRTELTWTINARSLQNFLQLRSHKRALWEICNLAHALFEAIPKEHQFIFAHHIDLGDSQE